MRRMINRRAIVLAVSSLLTVFLVSCTAQSQHTSEQQIQQYDPDSPPQHRGEHISGRRYKRMYAMCPPHFRRIGNECYFISPNRLNWLDAHFECKDRNSKLAEPMKYDDRNLRKYLQQTNEKNYIWIGGNYNWKANKWQWGYNGKNIGYQSFSQMIPGSSQDLKYHCAVLNPDLKFRWSAKLCTEKLNFICQHKMPFVNSHSRSKVYTRWNATFPNEMANEVEVEVVLPDQPGNNKQKDYYSMSNNTTVNPAPLNSNYKNRRPSGRAQRIKPSRVRLGNRNRNDFISNEIIRRPVVEYAEDNSHNLLNGNGNGNGYRYGNGAFKHGFNVGIYDQRKVNRNGEFRRHQHRHRLGDRHSATAVPPAPTTVTTTTTTTTTTPAPLTLPTEAFQVATEKYQPNLPLSHRDKLRERLERLTPEQREALFAKRVTTTVKPQLSHEEKKAQRQKLKERLNKLTPEERDMFFAERAKRKRSKKQRSKNETIP